MKDLEKSYNEFDTYIKETSVQNLSMLENISHTVSNTYSSYTMSARAIKNSYLKVLGLMDENIDLAELINSYGNIHKKITSVGYIGMRNIILPSMSGKVSIIVKHQMDIYDSIKLLNSDILKNVDNIEINISKLLVDEDVLKSSGISLDKNDIDKIRTVNNRISEKLDEIFDVDNDEEMSTFGNMYPNLATFEDMINSYCPRLDKILPDKMIEDTNLKMKSIVDLNKHMTERLIKETKVEPLVLKYLVDGTNVISTLFTLIGKVTLLKIMLLKTINSQLEIIDEKIE